MELRFSSKSCLFHSLAKYGPASWFANGEGAQSTIHWTNITKYSLRFRHWMGCWRCNDEWNRHGPSPPRAHNPTQGFPASVLLAFGAGQFFAEDGRPVHCRTLNSIPGFHQLAARSTAPTPLKSRRPQISPDVAKCLLGRKLVWIRTLLLWTQY